MGRENFLPGEAQPNDVSSRSKSLSEIIKRSIRDGTDSSNSSWKKIISSTRNSSQRSSHIASIIFLLRSRVSFDLDVIPIDGM